MYKWAYWLRQQSSVTVFVCRPRKTNFSFSFPFATNGNCHFPLIMFSVCIFIFVCIYIYIWANVKWIKENRIYIYNFQQKMEAQAIFLNPFTVVSSCKWKFVVCLFVGKKTNGMLANGLNGLAHLCIYVYYRWNYSITYILSNSLRGRMSGYTTWRLKKDCLTRLGLPGIGRIQ